MATPVEGQTDADETEVVEVETDEDAAGGGGEATDDATEGDDDSTSEDDSADVKPIIDWKAMARKWEKRSKENAKRAEENEAAKRKLDEATATNQTELDQLRSAIEELRTENSSNKLKALRVDVSQETGVPIELLTASTAEELQDQAEAIKAFVAANAPKPVKAAAAKPKEKLRSGAAASKSELSREEVLAAVLGKSRRRGASSK